MVQSVEDARRLHQDSVVIDQTCPLMQWGEQYLDWWIEGGVTAAAPTVGGSEPAGPTLRSLGYWLDRIENDDRLTHITSAQDIVDAKTNGKFGIIFHFQGTEPIENDLNLIDAFKGLGVGIIQLAYNVKNRVGDGCEERTDCGLSNFGVELIKRCNRAKVIVDCTHTGYQTTMDAMDVSTAPVVFSHSNPKAIKKSQRTITDDQIKAAAATGGLVGMVGFPAFVSDSSHPTLDEFVNHIDYVVELVGDDYIGLGIDYFGGQAGVADLESAKAKYWEAVNSGRWQPDNYPPPPYHYPEGIDTPRTFYNLTEKLVERGYSETSIKKILGENWLRVYRAVWGK